MLRFTQKIITCCWRKTLFLRVTMIKPKCVADNSYGFKKNVLVSTNSVNDAGQA